MWTCSREGNYSDLLLLCLCVANGNSISDFLEVVVVLDIILKRVSFLTWKSFILIRASVSLEGVWE